VTSTTLLRSARLAEGVVDVLLADGLVAAIGPRLDAPAGAETVDLGGRTLLPGLWDNHVHFDQWALARVRLDLAGARSAAAAAELVAERLRTDPPAAGAPLVGAGFRDALWPDRPHRELLDRASGPTPVVLLAADLHCCWINGAAAERYGARGHPTGVLRESDCVPIMERVAQLPRPVLDRYAADAAAAAAARGVVGIVDYEWPCSLDTWRERMTAGARLRVVGSVWPPRLDELLRRGLRTGDVVAGTGGLLTMGPLKVISDGSLNTRTAYCRDPYPGLEGSGHPCGMLLVPPDALRPLLRRATDAGLDCAVHAIGDHANTLALDAFAATGARGRIEHAQLLGPADLRRFAELGLAASVQPEHALDDRDVADHYWAGRTHRAFAYRSLLDAGARLVLGSDAPVAPLDPWVTLAAAVHRSADGRPAWHPEQQIPLDVALAASTRPADSATAAVDPAGAVGAFGSAVGSAGPTGAAGPVVVGRRADLVITDLDPATVRPDRLRTMPVAGTLLAGRWTHRTGL
jgi:predicted amidohydrolase YtcJ